MVDTVGATMRAAGVGAAQTAAGTRRRGPRLAASLFLGVAVLTALLVLHEPIRVAEASILARVLAPFTGAGSRGDLTLVYLGTAHAIGLRITPECTVAIPLAVVLVAYLWLALPHGTRHLALFGRLLLASCVLITLNLTRLVLIAVGVRWAGGFGFTLAHSILGGALSLVSVVVSVLLLVPGRASGPPHARSQP